MFTPLNESGSLTKATLLDVIQHLLACHGSDLLFEPQEDHHFGAKYPLVTVSEFPVEQVQVLLLKTRLSHAHELFGLLQCDACAANVSPAATSFELESGNHRCVWRNPGRRVVPPLPSLPTEPETVLGRHCLFGGFSDRQPHRPSERFILLKSDRRCLNGVRGDLVLIGHAFLPSLIFILCTARRIRNSALQKLPPCRQGFTIFPDHLSSNVFPRSCTFCSRVAIFPSTVSESC